jgi:hypothetical protein
MEDWTKEVPEEATVPANSLSTSQVHSDIFSTTFFILDKAELLFHNFVQQDYLVHKREKLIAECSFFVK